ncbi:MAG: hypothetical protein SPF19_13170 [Oliverpabstia sp.]|nr:hypothetical protein [Lachnospiraceae bacterium]MDY5027448.1 hypothetical protein [Oliverpabstia sp.]
MEQGHLLNELYETVSDGYMLETEYRYDDTWKRVFKKQTGRIFVSIHPVCFL